MSDTNSVKVAIHHRPGSFSDRWIESCTQCQVHYSVVDCYDSNIIERLKSFDVLLWNWHQGNYRDVRSAPYILSAAENLGLVVFPSSATCHTFDNKLAQKYQLESIGAPLVPTHVFFDEPTALDWLGKTTFPKVFKLSRGAGALNVHLVHDFNQAKSLVRRAFRKGFQNSSGQLRDNLGKLTSRRTRGAVDLIGKVKRLPSTLMAIASANRLLGREIGYVYFQDFIPDLKSDTRVVIIGDRAFAFQREVRENDFRASGSGLTIVDPAKIDMEFVRIAFDTSRRLNLQSAAYDFVRGQSAVPYLIEVSYTFPADKQVKDCPGHWDSVLQWHEGPMWPQDAILDDVLQRAARK